MKKIKFKPIKKRWIILIIFVVLIILKLSYSSFSNNKPKYEVSKIKKGNIENVIELKGYVEAKDTTEITSMYNYKVTDIYVSEGDVVEKNQVIAKLDTEDFEDEITLLEKDILLQELTLKEKQDKINDIYKSTDSLKLNVKNSKITLDERKDAYNKNKELYEAGAISKKELDDSKDSYEKAEIAYKMSLDDEKKGELNLKVAIKDTEIKDSDKESLDIKKTQLKIKQKKLEDLKIKSPIKGTVTRVYAKIGRNAKDTEDNKPMFIIEDDSQKFIKCKVGEYDIDNIKPNQKVTITADVLGKTEVEGTVNKILPTGEKATDGKNIVIPVKILINENDNRLISGVTAKVKIVTSHANNILKTGFENILSENGKNYVLAVYNNKVKKIKVNLGIESDLEVQVKSKLIKDNMDIITNPTSEIKDGDTVEIITNENTKKK